MPLPERLEPLVATRRFWKDFLWESESWSPDEDGPDAEPRDLSVELAVAGGFGLRLSFDESLGDFNLDFFEPGGDPVPIAWDDQAHWHPHVLRWAEVETIGRAVAMRDPELDHPGLVVLLLHRFAPICEGDDVEAVVATQEAAWRRLGLFRASEIAGFIERLDARDAGFRWQSGPEGWSIEQDEDDESRSQRTLYSLRRAGGEDFPHREWGRMIEAAEAEIGRLRSPDDPAASAFAETGRADRIPEVARSLRKRGFDAPAGSLERTRSVPQACWIAEAILGLLPGTLARRHAPASRLPRPQFRLGLHIPLLDARRPLPEDLARVLVDAIDGVQRGLDAGRCEVSGAISGEQEDGSWASEIMSIHFALLGDREAGLRLVRGLLWWGGVPAATKLFEGSAAIPLGLDRPPSAGDFPLAFQLGRLETTHRPYGCRIDRIPLTEETRSLVTRRLSASGAIGPDEEGWCEATTDDGGRLRLQLRRPDGDVDPDAATVLFEKLTPGSAALAYALMKDAGLMLLPMRLAPDAEVAARFGTQPSEVRVVDSPGRLHEVVAAGPYAWWAGTEAG